jgi:hypothetical protein
MGVDWFSLYMDKLRMQEAQEVSEVQNIQPEIVEGPVVVVKTAPPSSPLPPPVPPVPETIPVKVPELTQDPLASLADITIKSEVSPINVVPLSDNPELGSKKNKKKREDA